MLVYLWCWLWKRIIVFGSFMRTGLGTEHCKIYLLEYFFHYFYEIFIYNYYLLIMPAVWAFCILLGLGALIIPEERHIPPAVCVGTALGSARSSPCTQIFICGSQSDWQTTQYTQESLQLRTQSWPQALFQFPVTRLWVSMRNM